MTIETAHRPYRPLIARWSCSIRLLSGMTFRDATGLL
jgi:hypothetical protein